MLSATPAAAVPTDESRCLDSIRGSLSVSPSAIVMGRSVTVTWSTDVPDSQTCPGGFSQQLDGQFVAVRGSRVFQPTESHTFQLIAFYGGMNRALASELVLVSEPKAQLPGHYRGTITSDFAASTGLTADVTGPPADLTAVFALNAGSRVDCHGNHLLGGRTVTLTGHRVSVDPDGSSTYDLSGQFSLELTVHVDVDVTVAGATLTSDGQTFAGAASFLIRPSFGDNCPRTWTFTVDRANQTVPSVLNMTLSDATLTLTAAGLLVDVEAKIDKFCHILPGRIMSQSPQAGTLVALNTVVTIFEAVWPQVCP